MEAIRSLITACLITLIISFGSSCKKSNDLPEPLPQKVVFNQEGFEYIRLPLNKYLIYKDSASGEIDSVIVTKSLLEDIYHPRSSGTLGGVLALNVEIPPFYSESFTLILTKVNNGAPVEWFHGTASAGYPDPFALATKPASIQLKEQDPIPVFFSPGGLVIDSIKMEGQTYYDVRQYSSVNGLPVNHPNYSRGIFWWAKGIGIVKLQRFKSTGKKTYTILRHG